MDLKHFTNILFALFYPTLTVHLTYCLDLITLLFEVNRQKDETELQRNQHENRNSCYFRKKKKNAPNDLQLY